MILALAFLSGAAGLVYEVLWARHLALLFGATALAQTTVLAVFLGGLSAGGARLGRAVDRAASAARFYARLEWAVAALGLAAPLLLRFEGSWVRVPALALLFTQAYLMGGTIPALCRAAGGDAQTGVGRVYAANSAGAVAGCLAAAFALIPGLGLDGSFAAAAGLNVLAALGASQLRGAETVPAARGVSGAEPPLTPELVRAAVFVSGFVALTYEIAWTRALALALGSSAYSFAEMLAAFIAGASAGGLLASSEFLRRRDPARALGLALLGAGAAVLIALPLYDRLPYSFILLRSHFGDGAADFYGFEAAKFALSLALMLAPAACLGATLPLAARLVERGGGSARGADVGGVFAANAAGNVLGAFAGWLLLPWLGVEGILRSGTTVFAAAGAAILWIAWPQPTVRRRAAFAAGLAILVVYRAWLPRWDDRMRGQGLFREHKNLKLFDYADMRKLLSDATLLFIRDDREATVTVTRFAGTPGVVALKVNGKSDASNGADMMTQVLLGQLPLMLKPDARDVLLVGWGSGVTAGAMLRHPLEHLDAVELVPAVVDASDLFWKENGGARRDPRLDLRREDAKSFLARRGRAYDVIVSEPSNPWMAGVGDLFSVEFYRRAHARLKPGGVMVQWFHAYEMDDALFALVLRTFRTSFPNATLWNLAGTDVILVGSDAPLRPAAADMERAFARPEVAANLESIQMGRLSTLLQLQSAGEATVAALAGKVGPLNEERRPRLEYGAPLAFFRNDVVAALDARDDRRDPALNIDLILSRYLRERGSPLSAEEFLDRVIFSKLIYERPLIADWIAEWHRRYPRDPRAKAVAELFEKYGPH